MSWDEISRQKCKCKCGKGVVFNIIYADDWNRYDEKQEISCKDCSKTMHVEILSFPKNGTIYKNYYLVPNNFPKQNKTDNATDYMDKKIVASYELNFK